MSCACHHIEQDGACWRPWRWPETVALTCSHEGHREISVDCLGAAVASGDVMLRPLKSEEENACHLRGETKVSQNQNGDGVGDLVATAFGVVHRKGERVTCLPAHVAQ